MKEMAFNDTLGELGVPDRYVDGFQGRAPSNVITKYYTGNEVHGLKKDLRAGRVDYTFLVDLLLLLL